MDRDGIIKIATRIDTLLLTSALAVWGIGCATQLSVKAKPFKPASGEVPNLSKYTIVSVTAFVASRTDDTNATASGKRLAEDIAARLRLDFPGLFQEVRLAPPLAKDNEVIVTGVIYTYEPGSRTGRFILGVPPARLKGDLILKDGATGLQLMCAPFSKLWAWGGALGGAKGITEMMIETSAAAAATVAHGKRWNEPAGALK